jgi:hypothetical protein
MHHRNHGKDTPWVRLKDVLERFLGTLKSEIKEATRTKQPVLILIFGHGEKPPSSRPIKFPKVSTQ